MATPDFVQIHMLTSYPAVLLNRDDVGLAKRIPFGGSVRTRVSSQCLKKHWREDEAIKKLRDAQVTEVMVRTPLSCEATRGVCRVCYGQSLATMAPAMPADRSP